MKLSEIIIDRTVITRDSGIYKIILDIDSRFYIGSAKNIYNRLCRHLWELIKNKHTNQYLQRAWSKYGPESFSFEIIELCGIESLKDKEEFYLDSTKCTNRSIGFNIIKHAYGGCPSGVDHWNYGKPMKEETKEKLRVHRPDFSGPANPMFGKIGPMKGRVGTLAGYCKLTENDVIQIRNMKKDGAKRRDLSTKFNISIHTVDSITRKRTWKHI